MKIDLHCHTKKIKNGDPDTRNVSIEVFAEKIRNADIKILAITNHNTFDFEQYQLFRKKVCDFCDVWPGIELDAFGDQKKNDKLVKFHLIVIANPSISKQFKDSIDKLLNGFDVNVDSKHIIDICDSLKDLDVLFIPHYLGKTPAIPEDDLNLLRSLVPDSTKVFTETTESSIGVLVNNDFHALVGSDVRDWNSYEECMFSDLRLPVSSFEQFCMLARRDSVVIDTILNKKKSYSYSVNPHKNVTLSLKIFEDINIIFGQKGTGKSEILNSLEKNMTADGFKCVKYVGAQKEDDFNHLLNNTDLKANCEILGADNCEEDFQLLKNWKEQNITLFSKYINWFETKNNNANKRTMLITEAVDIAFPDDTKLKQSKLDRKLLSEAQEKIKAINLNNYLTNEEKNSLLSLFDKLTQNIYSTVLENYGEKKLLSW